MKTYRQYSKLLPEGIREMFLEEIEKMKSGKSKEHPNIIFQSPIFTAFIWKYTDCGFDFWWAVCNDFSHHYGLTPAEWDAALEKLKKKS